MDGEEIGGFGQGLGFRVFSLSWLHVQVWVFQKTGSCRNVLSPSQELCMQYAEETPSSFSTHTIADARCLRTSQVNRGLRGCSGEALAKLTEYLHSSFQFLFHYPYITPITPPNPYGSPYIPPLYSLHIRCSGCSTACRSHAALLVDLVEFLGEASSTKFTSDIPFPIS